jgi:hypothetical protein
MSDNMNMLQILNIFLTGGVLLTLLGAAVAYGKLMEKVESHESKFSDHGTRIGRIEEHIMERSK